MQFMEAIFAGASDYIEIREIDQDGKVKQRFFRVEELRDYKPPIDKNVYFGVYGRSVKDGSAKSCTSTGALWADYDDGRSLPEVKDSIARAGLPEPSTTVNSGHGFHCYWLLTERTTKDVTSLLRAIVDKTGADPKPTDRARVMRLPGTMNVKGEPVPCEIMEMYGFMKYPLGDFTAVLGVETEEPNLIPYLKKKSPVRLGIEADRPCIKAILQGVPEGERNFALGRLTKWFQVKGYTKDKTQGIIVKWNKLNDPPEHERKLLKDFYAYWHGDYKLLGCALKRPELQQILGKYCNRPGCKFTETIGRIELDNAASYNNRLLSDLHKLTGNDLIIYGLLARHKEGLTTSQLGEKLTVRATGKSCMSKPTRTKSLETLSNLGFIDVVNGRRRDGLENLYKLRTQGTFGLGYTLVSNGAINGAIDKRITPGELRLYVLLLKYAFTKGSCYPSIRTLGKDLGTTHNNISLRLKGLEQGDYIKRDYRVFNGTEKLFTTMLI